MPTRLAQVDQFIVGDATTRLIQV